MSRRDSSRFGVLTAVRQEWREIGGLGRLALIGVLAAAILAVVLGFEITAAARGHLLDSRADILEAIIDELPPFGGTAEEIADFDEAVRERVVGGETVRVKLWLADGTVAYSDDGALIGVRFPLTAPALRAFEGEIATAVSDLSDPAHEEHRDLGSLIEIYIPIAEGAEVEAVFEVEQRTDRLEAALGRIERNVWLSISAGLIVLGVFLGALALARAREVNRRRRQAEQLLGALLRAQDEEQRRIIGYLHDDVGQPLYRLLYGIEGSMARLPPDHPVAAELSKIADLTREVDHTLRAELRMLGHGAWTELGLAPALTSLVDTVRSESDLEIEMTTDIVDEPDPVPTSMIVRAASEALTNIRKHARASVVELTATSRDGQVQLEVVDNGTGPPIEPGLGLTTTDERLQSIGGSLTVTSERRRGTRFVARAPTRQAT